MKTMKTKKMLKLKKINNIQKIINLIKKAIFYLILNKLVERADSNIFLMCDSDD